MRVSVQKEVGRRGLRDARNETRLQSLQVALKRVRVISGRGVYSRRTGGQREGGGGHINLPNDGEEGFSVGSVFVVFVCVNRVLISTLFPLQVKAQKGQKYEATPACAPKHHEWAPGPRHSRKKEHRDAI